MAETSYGFRTGWLGAINSDGTTTPLRSFSFEIPLAWTVVNGSSVSAWRFSRKVLHNIARREARARRREAKRG